MGIDYPMDLSQGPMQPCIQKRYMAKHCPNSDNEHKHQAKMTEVRPGREPWEVASLLLPAHSDSLTVVLALLAAKRAEDRIAKGWLLCPRLPPAWPVWPLPDSDFPTERWCQQVCRVGGETLAAFVCAPEHRALQWQEGKRERLCPLTWWRSWENPGGLGYSLERVVRFCLPQSSSCCEEKQAGR